MHLGIRESVALARGVVRHLRGKLETPDLVLCPSFTSLSEVHKVLARSRVSLGAQDVGFDRTGPYTGAISAAMLQDVGCGYVIIGHTERRRFFGETDQMIEKKISTIDDSKLTPIVCIGESFTKNPADAQQEILRQLDVFQGFDLPRGRKLYIAYEPVWSVGTGKPADVGAAVEIIGLIRDTMASRFGLKSPQLRVLYGGSIDPKNAYQFLREAQIDGLMVGAESIKLQSFEKIIDAAIDVMNAQAKL